MTAGRPPSFHRKCAIAALGHGDTVSPIWRRRRGSESVASSRIDYSHNGPGLSVWLAAYPREPLEELANLFVSINQEWTHGIGQISAVHNLVAKHGPITERSGGHGLFGHDKFAEMAGIR